LSCPVASQPDSAKQYESAASGTTTAAAAIIAAASAVVAVLAAAVMADCFSPFFLMIFAQLLQCCGTAATAR